MTAYEKIQALRADGWTDNGICADLNFDMTPCPYGQKWLPEHLDKVPVPVAKKVQKPVVEVTPSQHIEGDIYLDSDGMYFYKLGEAEGARFRTKLGAVNALGRMEKILAEKPKPAPRGEPKVKVKVETVAKGVTTTHSGRFAARIQRGGKTIYLGTFPTIEAAIHAHAKAVEKHPLVCAKGKSEDENQINYMNTLC